VSVRLAMLARDEADCMLEIRDAARGLYDDWIVLVDDRTTDATQEAAATTLEGSGRSERFTFQDFSQARNLLLEKARVGLDPKEDFILLCDPDSPPSGTLPGLIHDWYAATWRMGQVEWRIPTLLRAGLECHYEGAAHELLHVTQEDATSGVSEIVVVVTPKPFSQERNELYLELLLPDAPTDARAAFYLARTYADLQRRGEAIEAFLHCAQMMQPAEQAYLAVLGAGQQLAPLDVDLARVLWERARAMRPHRGETLYHLAWLANQMGDAAKAAAYCAEAVQLAPCADGLFVNRWADLELGRALERLRADDVPTLPED
jgi:tetratricopeptide (TPR) repeat protein